MDTGMFLRRTEEDGLEHFKFWGKRSLRLWSLHTEAVSSHSGSESSNKLEPLPFFPPSPGVAGTALSNLKHQTQRRPDQSKDYYVSTIVICFNPGKPRQVQSTEY